MDLNHCGLCDGLMSSRIGMGLSCASLLSLGGIFINAPALAQSIVPDGSLGTAQSQVRPALVDGRTGWLIQGGAQQGSNLFHSFVDFNVASGQPTYFANPTGVSQIFGRVTGTQASAINDKLAVAGPASLFLLNPNGIIFGPEASLDISGSFVATTATAFDFGNGLNFGVEEPGPAPLFTLSTVPGLQLGNRARGVISSTGNLSVGQDLTLAGHSLDLQGDLQAGGDLALRSRAPIRLGGDFLAGGNVLAENWSNRLSPVVGQTPVSIQAAQDVAIGNYNGAGLTIEAGGQIKTDDISVSSSIASVDGIRLIAGGQITTGSLSTAPEDIALGSASLGSAGNIQLKSTSGGIQTGAISASSTGNYSRLLLSVITDPNFDPEELLLIGGKEAVFDAIANVFQDLKINGDGGNISLEAPGVIQTGSIDSVGNRGGLIEIFTQSPLVFEDKLIQSFTIGTQKGRDVRISAPDLSVKNFSIISTLTMGEGDGGDISINVPGRLEITTVEAGDRRPSDDVLRSPSQLMRLAFLTSTAIAANTISNTGNSGKVFINAGDFLIHNQSDYLNPNNFDDISESSNDSIFNENLESVGISTAPLFESRANGGDITIQSRSLEIIGNQPGKFEPRVLGSLSRNQVRIRSGLGIPTGLSTTSNGKGSPANVRIETDTLRLKDGVEIDVAGFPDTPKDSERKSLSIHASDSIELEGKAVIITTTIGESDANNLSLIVDDNGKGIFLSQGAIISADALPVNEEVSGGGAGKFRIQTPRLQLTGGSRMGAGTGRSAGGAGTVEIVAHRLEVIDSLISAETADGQAGGLTIDARDSVYLSGQFENGAFGNSAGLLAGAQGTGEGGDIQLNTKQLTIENGAAILATTQSNQGGDVLLQGLERLQLNQGSISASTGSGTAGNLRINQNGPAVKEVNIVGDSSLTVAATASGNAGDISLNARNVWIGDGASLVAKSTTGADLVLVPTSSRELPATGQGGSITLTAEQLTLDNGSITVQTTGKGNAGNIVLDAQKGIVMRNGSIIETDAVRSGDGGNIEISTPVLLSFEEGNSDIIANANTGTGGNIQITADSMLNFEQKDGQTKTQLRESKSNDISASSESGVSGTITLNAPNTQPDSALDDLPDGLVETENQIARRCAARGAIASLDNSFYVTGRSGLPQRPGRFATEFQTSGVRAWSNSPNSLTAQVASDDFPVASPSSDLVEAQAWSQTATGAIQLMAGTELQRRSFSCAH